MSKQISKITVNVYIIQMSSLLCHMHSNLGKRNVRLNFPVTQATDHMWYLGLVLQKQRTQFSQVNSKHCWFQLQKWWEKKGAKKLSYDSLEVNMHLVLSEQLIRTVYKTAYQNSLSEQLIRTAYQNSLSQDLIRLPLKHHNLKLNVWTKWKWSDFGFKYSLVK